jgi:hypothetical protein
MTDNPESAFHAYMRAFETLDPEAALLFYHLPSMFIAPQGVFTVPDASTARALLSQFMEQLRSQSYRRTEVVGLTVRKSRRVLPLAPVRLCASTQAVRKSRGLVSLTLCATQAHGKLL